MEHGASSHRGGEPPADADSLDDARARGARGCVRLPLRPLQHRRSGPVLRRLDAVRSSSRSDFRLVDMTGCAPHLVADPRRLLAGAAWRDRRLPEGHRGRPRGDHDDHAQLDRLLDRSYLFGMAGRSRQRSDAFRPPRTSRRGAVPVFWGDPLLQGLHIGFFVAILALVVYSFSSTARRSDTRCAPSGHNPEAARYGGISVARNYFLAMAIAGSFAGLAGALDCSVEFRLDVDADPGLDDRLRRHRGRAARSEHRPRRRSCQRSSSPALRRARRRATSTPAIFPPDLAWSLRSSSRDSSCSSWARTS